MTWSLTPKYKLSPQLEALRKKWGGEAIQDKISGTIALKNKNGIFRDSGIATNAKGHAQQFDLKSGHFIINDPVERGRQNLIRLIPKYGGHVRRNSSGNWELVNNNGVFYASGTARDNQGRERTFNINSGHFTDGLSTQKTQKPSIESEVSADSDTSKPRTSAPPATSRPRTALAPKAPASNSWINKNKGIWNYNGVSQTDVANAYKTGDFSKVGNYLSQHRDLASYLNNIYSKRGGNQFNSSTNSTQQTTPTQGAPDRSIHVGNNRVTYTDSQGNTTDVTNSHNLSEIIWGKQGQPSVNTQLLEQTASNLINPNQHTFNRRETRDFMRQNLLNPYDYSASERRAFRHSISNDTGDWSNASKIMSDARINKSLSKSIDAEKNQFLVNPQLSKPNLGYDPSQNNQLVSLKFKQGGQMYKYQQGGQTQQTNGQQDITQQAIALVQAAMQGDQQANQTIQQITQAAQQGDQQALQIAQLLQAIIQKMQGSRKARLGAKLNYFKQVSECPEGQEVVYFKKGGEICKVCAGKKMQNGGKSDPIKEFKKRKNRKEIGKDDANVAPWNYKKKR